MPTPVSPTAIITYGPGLHRDVRHGVRLVDLDVRRLDGELPAERHRVARVHGEVDEDLLDRRRIDADRPQVGRQRRDELDVFADQPAQQLLELPAPAC